MEEIWKDVKGYEGLYQVSNFGRVKRLPYSITSRTPKGYVIKRFKGGLLKTSIMANGYRRVTLYKDLNVKYIHVHRLVAEAYSKNHSRAVEMLSLFGEKIKEFPSIREAAIFVGGTATSICRAITRTRKTAYGYIWNLI